MTKICINCKIGYPNSIEYFRDETAKACRQCGECYLTDAQKVFLNKHHIYPKQVYDICGMQKKSYQQQMTAVDKIIGAGANPCRSSGHTLKMLSGHCPQCNTHHIEFTLRWFDDKFVYLAFSNKTQLIKIGVADNIIKREFSLNETNYGSINDWKILDSQLIKKAGQVEAQIQKELSENRVFRKFWKDNKIVYSSEIFDCTLEDAKIAFEKFINKN